MRAALKGKNLHLVGANSLLRETLNQTGEVYPFPLNLPSIPQMMKATLRQKPFLYHPDDTGQILL